MGAMVMHAGLKRHTITRDQLDRGEQRDRIRRTTQTKSTR